MDQSACEISEQLQEKMHENIDAEIVREIGGEIEGDIARKKCWKFADGTMGGQLPNPEGAFLALWYRPGLLVNMSSDRSCTRGMIHNNILLFSMPSISVQCRIETSSPCINLRNPERNYCEEKS